MSVDPLAHLKSRLFALASRGALLRIASALGLEGLEQRHTYAIINAIRDQRSFNLPLVLEQLSDVELKMLASDLGFKSLTRQERTSALLGYAGGSFSSPPGPGLSCQHAAEDTAPLPASPPVPHPALSLPEETFALLPPASRGGRSKKGSSRLPGAPGEPFVAIDFETADHGRDSACAVALVRVEEDRIVRRVAWLIRPPRRRMLHTGVHGITWEMVAGQPTFGELWPRLAPLLEGVAYLVAHNAGFDRKVLQACCATYGIPIPSLEMECTMQMARRLWGVPQANLPSLCQRFGLPLRHHDAASDAEACARLVLVARSQRFGGGE
ncbi:MAG: 3'-5' exonuclease [Myxococcales bacterium]|nr:3'-5' exonuclease [Polyangiaceae bacterium]MDW8250899.1 3'-5' exonuclease [Myxococcales bacterium]